jgi:hypothetical protein
MPQLDSPDHYDPRKMRDSYVQLGLEPGATMREIETAYWQFARELRGASMTPYTVAYEALVNSVKPRANDARPAPVAPPEAPPKQITLVSSSPSKFGWPAN